MLPVRRHFALAQRNEHRVWLPRNGTLPDRDNESSLRVVGAGDRLLLWCFRRGPSRAAGLRNRDDDRRIRIGRGPPRRRLGVRADRDDEGLLVIRGALVRGLALGGR